MKKKRKVNDLPKTMVYLEDGKWNFSLLTKGMFSIDEMYDRETIFGRWNVKNTQEDNGYGWACDLDGTKIVEDRRIN